MLSYAQNGEDVVLNRVFAEQECGFYVDIGACDPCNDSVTLHFYERNWRGVNVEPDRALHAAFLQVRARDVNLCVAVGRARGRVAFYPTGTRGHGTLDATLAESRTAGRSEERVPMITLSDVIDCYGPDDRPVDFLKIDVEGSEASVLASADWSRHRPRVLVIEAVDVNGIPNHEPWEQDLLSAGYQFGMFDGLNRFYCRDEDANLLLARLSSPANVRDGWKRAEDARAHKAVTSLRTECEGLQADLTTCREHSAALQTELTTCHEHSTALQTELATCHEHSTALQTELATCHEHSTVLQTELTASREHAEVLVVDAARARAEAAAALRREAAAEASMAVAEMDLLRHETELCLLASRADEAEAWLAAVRSSASWKVTRPYRVAARWLRRPLGRRA
jgi:FkbM family methyltransferase